MAIKVVLKKDETLESALKRFKKLQEREGIAKELRGREYFEKPSAKRHQHDKDIQYKHKKKMKKLKRARGEK
jgi:small subunit ribosomal protein S21